MSLLSDFVPSTSGGRRARLVSKPALFSYLIFVAALFLSTSLVRLKLPGILGYASNINASDLLKFTNEKRVQNGLKEVKLDDQLCKAAEAKAKYMFEKNFWAHVAPDGTEPWDFILGNGYDYLYAGENLAKDFQTSDGVVDAWMNSLSHKDNLLGSNYDEIGFAVVNGTLNGYETTLVVQMFGRRRGVQYLAEVDQGAAKEEAPIASAVPATQGSSQQPENPPRKEPANVPAEVIIENSPLNKQPEKFEAPIREQEEGALSRVLPAFDIFAMSKSISLFLTIFVAGLFALDGYLAHKRNEFRLTGHTFAHVIVLLAALIGIWYVNVGTIL